MPCFGNFSSGTGSLQKIMLISKNVFENGDSKRCNSGRRAPNDNLMKENRFYIKKEGEEGFGCFKNGL